MKNILTTIKERLADQVVTTPGDEQGLTTYLNPYSYLLIRQSDVDLSKFTRIYIDGGLLARALRILIRRKLQRVSFDMTSAAPVLFARWSKEGRGIYFIGAKEEEITRFMAVIVTAFPGLHVTGYRNGYFSSDEERKSVIREICDASPDILIAGMGTPLQERFLIDAREAGWQGAGYTCGGFLHQTGSKLSYYPNWINKMGLRWAYRIYDEPGLARRYFLAYPRALLWLAIDALRLEQKS